MESRIDPTRRNALKDALMSGTSACMVSTLALAVCSKLEEGSAAGAINGPSQWLWGEREAYTRRATLKHTAVGHMIHHVSAIFWAVVYEHLFGPSRRDLRLASPSRIALNATAIASFAYVCDYSIAPSRMRPGFKKHLGPVSIFATYAAFAMGLAAATLVRKRRLRTSG